MGSVRNAQVNYPKDQACFDRWDGENVPESKISKVVRTVKDEVDKDLLGTKKPAWDATVGTVGHDKDETTQKQLFEIKRGLRDEKIEQPKEGKVYVGCDTREAHNIGWSVSTETVHPRDSERFLQATRGPMLEKTKTTNVKMLHKHEQNTGASYVTPEALGGKVGKDTRQKKEDEIEVRAEIEVKVRNEYPASSEETINAIVTRRMYEKNLAARIPDDKELTLRPNMTRTL